MSAPTATRVPIHARPYDEETVSRIVGGAWHGGWLHPADRHEVVRRLEARGGMSAAQIADRVGCAPRTVVRVRARLRASGFPQ